MQSTSSPDYKTLYEQSQLRIVALEQQLNQLQKMIFGSRHERFVPADKNNPQLSLDISADPVATGSITSTQKISYIRNTVAIENKPVQHPGRMKLLETLRKKKLLLNRRLILPAAKKWVKRSPKCWNINPGSCM